MAVGHAFQHILEVGEGLDVVELCGADEGADRCPACGAAIGSCEQVVLAAERDGADGAFDGVGVEFNASVIEEAAKGTPAVQRVADRIGQPLRGGMWVSCVSSQALIAMTSGSDFACRVLCRSAAVCPRMAVSIA